MKKTLTRAEMLTLWRTIRTAEPLRLDCTVTRTDGPDHTAALEAEMRARYLDLLDSGPERCLAPVDMASVASVVNLTPEIVTVTLPADVRRVLRVRFAGWATPLEPTLTAERQHMLAANPYWRRPSVATLGPRMIVATGASGPLVSAVCVVDYGPETYTFDDSALSELLKFDNQ